jgi:hypothetical protein
MVARMLASVLRPRVLALAYLTHAAVAPAAAQATEPVDEKAVAILRKHGLEQSQVMEHLSWICDVHGPRLTGSPNLHRAQEWARQTFTGFGLQNARLEAWGPFGRGWQLDHVSMTVIGDNPWPVIAYPKAWSPSLAGRTEAEVVLIAGVQADDVRSMDLTGKIVLMDAPREVSEPFEGHARRWEAEDLLSMADGAAPARARERRDGPRAPGAPAPAATAPADFRQGFALRGAVMRLLYEKKPLAILDRGSKGDYGTVFVQGAQAAPTADEGGGGSRPYAKDAAPVIPQFTLAVEHYNRMYRMLQKGVPVRVALELKTTFTDGDGMEHNVLADLPGTDPAIGDEVVMLGAHFDSWHTGTGATDNGCGSAVVMEAMRLLTVLGKETGTGPRRTIRVALWSGEEQGLLGSRAYVREHFAVSERRPRPDAAAAEGEAGRARGRRGGGSTITELKPAHAKLSGYFNLDNGTGRIRGVYLQGNEAVAPIFRAWLRPFHDLGAHTLTLNDTGGTDHQSFDGVGLPGFQFIQDPVSYSPRTHHSNMDNWDHAVADDLRQAATIMAAFAWHCAQRDEKLPRKPMRGTAQPAAAEIEPAAGQTQPARRGQ